MTLNVFTAPRCKLTFNGVAVALAKSVTVQEETRYDPIDVLDSIETLDHEPVAYTCSMSAGHLVAIGTTLEALALTALKGANPAEHLRNLLALKTLTAQLEDSAGGTVVGRVFGVRIASKNMALSPGQSMARDINCVATRFVEASETIAG